MHGLRKSEKAAESRCFQIWIPACPGPRPWVDANAPEAKAVVSIRDQAQIAAYPLKVLETERLVLRRLTVEDAAFILRLLNEPAWKLHIGDFGVGTLEDARKYIEKGPVAMYARMGFGLCRVELKSTGEPIGICGLIKRASLDDVDVGYALLREFWGKGYAYESAAAVMAYGRGTFHLDRIVAISSKDNHASARLLEKLGFQFERMVRLKADAEEVNLYVAGQQDGAPFGHRS
jgi:[ribosomal protein S5]-alanine N-acetyltransferase